ncbi:MAG: hypothetical protein ABIJ09_03945 [Pseudomonadota bacterium]
MTDSRFKQDSLIMREAHFKNLHPTPIAERIHEILSSEMGPIIATAAIRRASDHAHIAIDVMAASDMREVIPVILNSLKPYRTSELLRQQLQTLLEELAPR